jgi:hypothetical protein
VKRYLCLLLLNLFSFACLGISAWMVTLDKWHWAVFFIAAVSFFHVPSNKKELS